MIRKGQEKMKMSKHNNDGQEAVRDAILNRDWGASCSLCADT